MRKGYWKTKDGKEIKIKDMDANHLMNIIRFIERKTKTLKWDTIASGHEVLNMMNGEMAQISIENDLDELSQMDDTEFLKENIPVYKNLINEARRRKLI